MEDNVAEDKKTSKVLKDKDIKQLEDQIIELTAALQRERADATNIRRRTDEEKTKLAGYYKASVVSSFLPVIDNFERSLKHIPEDLKDNSYIKGMQGIVRQFEETLASLGVKKIETLDKEFDPLLHEAVAVDGEEGDKEMISEELQSGYQLDNEVMRPAMVKIKRV